MPEGDAEGWVDIDEEDREEKRAGAPAWMVTFGDMMSLLLTFFVLLLSFSNMDEVRFKEMAGSMEDAFGVKQSEPDTVAPPGTTHIFESSASSKSDANIMSKLQEMKAAAKNRKGEEGKVTIEVFEDYRGIVLQVGDGNMFHAGRAEVKPGAWPFLDDVVAAVEDDLVEISVEAHTDNVPIKSAMFPSNWHLSAARSVSVVDYLVRAGKLRPSRLSAVGRGDSRPLLPNISSKNRARNRRLEFVFSRKAKKR